jgi:signal transduction histidine kinase
MQLNEDIQAAGVYGAQGELIEGYVKHGAALPARVEPHPPRIKGVQLTVVEPVEQDSLKLGAVYVRAIVEPWTRRASRYFGIGAVLIMAALMIAALGASYASASAANRRLQEEIAAREEAESQLRQAQKMEAIGQLTGGVAHDFNNMLMAASSGLELLERAKDPERREKLKRGIREALDRGAKLTQQLLTFARRAPLQREVVDVRARLAGLSDLLERSLREDISVEYDFAEGLWPIEVDPSQFDVAVLNIAVNARDAMPQGGTIRITARNAPARLDGADAVEIAIADQGSGMTPDQIDKAFEPFFTTKGVGQGTGLGLSQVYGFTRALGGTAAIESCEGLGTTVTMLLPRSDGAAAGDAPGADAIAGASSLDRRVLLIEDDDALAGLIGEMLGELGCTLTRRGSADEALDAFERGEVDVVITDMVMPGGRDGLDLARELRRRWPDLPVLLMTGYSSAANSAAEEGFHVLRKPFTIPELAACLGAMRPATGDRSCR